MLKHAANLLFPAVIILCFTCEAAAGGKLLEYLGGVRQLSMGGSASALSGSPDSAPYNPAAPARTRGVGASLMYDRLFLDTAVYRAVISFPAGGTYYGINFLFYDGGELTIDSLEEPGLHGRKVRAQSDYLISAVFARPLSARIDAGAALKYYNSKLIEEYSAAAVTADAGIILHTSVFGYGTERIYTRTYSPGIQVGISASNVYGELRYDRVSEKFEPVFRAGASYPIRFTAGAAAVFTAGASYSVNQGIVPAAGAEYGHEDMLFLRLGYRMSDAVNRFSYGLGFRYGGFDIDYGMLPGTAMNNRHLFMLSFYPGGR